MWLHPIGNFTPYRHQLTPLPIEFTPLVPLHPKEYAQHRKGVGKTPLTPFRAHSALWSVVLNGEPPDNGHNVYYYSFKGNLNTSKS